MSYALGIDLGTSSVKVALFDLKGTCIGDCYKEYPLLQPQNGWAEQEPEVWWQATIQAIKELTYITKTNESNITSIGLSGQMHGLVMLDKDGMVLRPSIIWCDQRTSLECAQMEQLVGADNILNITANPPMTGFTAAKILWVQKNEPQIYERCAHILLPKDYIRFRLSGEFASDVSDASGMQLMDIKNRCWSPFILSKLNISKDLLPTLTESTEVSSYVSLSGHLQTGLLKGTPIVAGAGDNASTSIGAGVIKEGSAFTTIGSSAVIFAVSDTLKIDLKGRVHSLCASVPGKWTVMSCTQGAGLSLKWLKDTCCYEEVLDAKSTNQNIYDLMSNMANSISIGSDKLLFLPYLMGERSPHPNPDCRGVFFGLSNMHKKAHMIRSVLEGVAFSQKECLDVFTSMNMPVSDMLLLGGGAQSSVWRQIISDVYNLPVNILKVDQGAAFGAAILAQVGTRQFSNLDEACTALVQKKSSEIPVNSNVTKYLLYFTLYKDLYKHLLQDFSTLAKL